MKKRICQIMLIACIFLVGMQAMAQEVEQYGLERNMPVFYENLKGAAVNTMSYDQLCKRYKGKKALRQAVMQTMQVAPPAPEGYDYKVTAVEQRDGYVAQSIEFGINKWERVKAYLLVPEAKEGKHPALLMLHDHGAHFTIGKEKMVRPILSKNPADSIAMHRDSIMRADAEAWIAACYDGVYVGDELAKAGYVVLSIDALFWGDRAPKEMAECYAKGMTTKEVNKAVYDRQQALASNMLQMGTSWGAWITWDDMRAAAFLAHLPMVDGKRVGCLGFSMGAYRSWMLAALSDDIKASASVCWMNDTAHLMSLTNNQNKGGSAFSMLIPGIRNVADYPQVAALAAPKAALFFNGKRDKLFPVDGVEASYGVMQQAWASQKAADRLTTKLWDEKHFFNKAMQAEVIGFFDKWLK